MCPTMKPKVLLVEDNRPVRWWLMSVLGKAGFWVAGPDTVEEALRWAHAFEFDLLVTDWRLVAGHDGFEVLEHLRRKSPLAAAILMSAEVDEDLERHSACAGFDRVLPKPFAAQEMVELAQALTKEKTVEVAS